MEDDDLSIFTTGENVRKARVIDDTIDIGFMTIQCLNTGLRLIIPHFDSLCNKVSQEMGTKSSLPVIIYGLSLPG